MKKDGHTHTEFCPHGSREDVEQFILRAIELGFDEYSITEHPPLPKAFMEQAGGDEEVVLTAGMSLSDVEYYLNKMHRLKKKYDRDILIHVGFEMDYLPGFEGWTTDFLNEYGKQMDDSVLSLHFLEGNGGFRGIDYSAEDYQEGIVNYYGSFQRAQEQYYQTLLESVHTDLGPYKPSRIGHITLCQKFQGFFQNEATDFSETSLQLIDELLNAIKGKNYELDFNTAGAFKEYCRESYPPKRLMNLVREKGIRFVYGSDAHHIQDVGRGYHLYLEQN